MTSAAPVAVVYLARKAEGITPLRRFAETYLAHDAGEAHELVVIFKGFAEDDSELTEARQIFSALPHRDLHVDDTGIDITAYLFAAERIPHQTVCFLNTFSEIDDHGWLHKLLSHLRREGVGLVGATGSYESLRSSMDLLSKAVWLCAGMQIPFDKKFAKHYQWVLKSQFPSWLDKPPARSLRDRWKAFVLARSAYRQHDEAYETHWNAVTQPSGPIAWAPQYPKFPNPHIRSNCFAIDRQRLLDFKFPKIVDKMEACAFESADDSLTARIRGSGLSALVVGKDSIGYDIPDWPASRTFRLGDQRNIIVTDNQSRNFANYSPEERATHVFMTWGDYVAPMASGFPGLGKTFRRASQPL